MNAMDQLMNVYQPNGQKISSVAFDGYATSYGQDLLLNAGSGKIESLGTAYSPIISGNLILHSVILKNSSATVKMDWPSTFHDSRMTNNYGATQ
jgi:hypothetical protein